MLIWKKSAEFIDGGGYEIVTSHEICQRSLRKFIVGIWWLTCRGQLLFNMDFDFEDK